MEGGAELARKTVHPLQNRKECGTLKCHARLEETAVWCPQARTRWPTSKGAQSAPPAASHSVLNHILASSDVAADVLALSFFVQGYYAGLEADMAESQR